MLLLSESQHDRPADDRFAKTAGIQHGRVAGREKVVGSQVKERDGTVLVVADLVAGCRPPARTLEALIGVKESRALRHLKGRQRQLIELLVGAFDKEVIKTVPKLAQVKIMEYFKKAAEPVNGWTYLNRRSRKNLLKF